MEFPTFFGKIYWGVSLWANSVKKYLTIVFEGYIINLQGLNMQATTKNINF